MAGRFLATAVLALSLAVPCRAADYTIFMMLWTGCEEACNGFQDYLVEAGLDVEFVLRDADKDHGRLPGFVAEARAANADLILSWGTSATRGTAGTLDDLEDPAYNHDIPHVFTVVADPVGSRIVESLDNTGRPNVTGTFNRVPEAVNIETIRIYDPDFDHLGMLYNANEYNSVLKYQELRALTAELGYQLTGIEMPLGANGSPRAEDIEPAIAKLEDAGVDFIYVGSSSFLDANRDIFTGAAVDHRIPVLSPYERLVKNSQALISIAARYYDVGRLAGMQAEKILVDGVIPGELAVARMTDFAFVINMTVAKELDMFPPIELLQSAETVN